MTRTYLTYLVIGVVFAPLAWAAEAPRPDDPLFHSSGSWGQTFDDQWALIQQGIYSTDAAALTEPQVDGQDVIVAIIDTGLDYTHEDLSAASVWRNPREKPNGRDDDANGFADDLMGWNFVDDNNNPWDNSGHGTHIAGVIAACTYNGIGIAGANPKARIMPLKVANFAGQARSASVAAAIYYAVDHGARIINLSLGGEVITELEKQAALYAQQRDVLIIVPAGNRGMSTDTFGYATLPGAMVVGASEPNGERAGFSNFGTDLNILAAGVDVLSLRARESDFIAMSDPLDYPADSAVVGEDERYYRASGTSFSTALASGVASRILSLRPSLTNAELARVMTQSAKDIGPAGVDQLSGYGALQFQAAMTQSEREYIRAAISSAKLQLADGSLSVNVLGSAGASAFASAELQVRASADSVPAPAAPAPKEKRRSRSRKSERKPTPATPDYGDPYSWQSVATLANPVKDAVLASLQIDELSQRTSGSTDWELRLQVNDKNGDAREAFMRISLPTPGAPNEQ